MPVRQPGAIAPTDTHCTWASMLPAATAMPSGRPKARAHSALSGPTREPRGTIGWLIFSLKTPPKPGASASRNSLEG